ncbi:hypothetical protein Tco_0689005 [Tanacetum coccineum]
MEQMTSMCDMVGQFIQKKEEEKRIEEEQAAKEKNDIGKIPLFPQEANHNAVTEEICDASDSAIERLNLSGHLYCQYGLLILQQLKRQEHDAYDVAEVLKKEFAQDTEDLLLQAGVAKASSTNIVNTASTPVCTASTYGGLSFTDLTNTDQDDSKIPTLEEINNNPTDGIFTNTSYDDEGAVADFTNLETVVNVSPIPTSRINSIHPLTLILRDPKLAVQTQSKVTKSFGARGFLKNVPVPLDHFPINALTNNVFSFMVKKGKHFSGKVTPLFPNMLVQLTVDEGEGSERPSEPQPIPSPPHLRIMEVTNQAKEIKHLKAQIKKLKKKAKPIITHHKAWMKSGRKSAKAEPTVHKDLDFDELDDDAIDYMETEDAQDVGRTRYVVHEEKESAEKEVRYEDPR